MAIFTCATNETAFFNVKMERKSPFPGISDIQREIQSNIISFSVEENMSEETKGSIRLYDEDFSFMENFVSGTGIELEWGYESPDLSLKNMIKGIDTKNSIKGDFTRKGIKATVRNPSGNCSGSGYIYNCSFKTNEFNEVLSASS